MAYPEVLQLVMMKFIQCAFPYESRLIKVAIYEIYGMKWGADFPNLRWGDMAS